MNHELKRAPFLKEVNRPLIMILAGFCISIDGAFVEFGTAEGKTFQILYDLGANDIIGHEVHAFDTFAGMPFSDSNENDRFLPGSFRAECEEFKKRFPKAHVHKGLIQCTIYDCGIEKIAFAHIDLDHHEPTLLALQWAWERMSDLGIVCIHDYYHHDNECASRAVKEWAAELKLDYIGVCDNSIFYQKGVS